MSPEHEMDWTVTMKKDLSDVHAYTSEIAHEIVADDHETFVAIVQRAIESDLERMNDDRWKKFRKSPDRVAWMEWSRHAIKKRITDAFGKSCGNREMIRRMLFGPKATDIVAMSAKRVLRTASAGAAGYVAALPLVGGNPYLAAIGALAAIGGEKAGRETIKKSTGRNVDILIWIIEIAMKLWKRFGNKGGETNGG